MTAVLAFLARNWPVALAVIVAATVLWAINSNTRLRYENADLRASLKASQVRAESLEYDLKAHMAALVEREADNRELARRYDKDLAALRASFAATPEACEWSQDKIPDSVLEALGCRSQTP